jgi:hypothetical protein
MVETGCAVAGFLCCLLEGAKRALSTLERRRKISALKKHPIFQILTLDEADLGETNDARIILYRDVLQRVFSSLTSALLFLIDHTNMYNIYEKDALAATQLIGEFRQQFFSFLEDFLAEEEAVIRHQSVVAMESIFRVVRTMDSWQAMQRIQAVITIQTALFPVLQEYKDQWHDSSFQINGQLSGLYYKGRQIRYTCNLDLSEIRQRAQILQDLLGPVGMGLQVLHENYRILFCGGLDDIIEPREVLEYSATAIGDIFQTRKEDHLQNADFNKALAGIHSNFSTEGGRLHQFYDGIAFKVTLCATAMKLPEATIHVATISRLPMTKTLLHELHTLLDALIYNLGIATTTLIVTDAEEPYVVRAKHVIGQEDFVPMNVINMKLCEVFDVRHNDIISFIATWQNLIHGTWIRYDAISIMNKEGSSHVSRDFMRSLLISRQSFKFSRQQRPLTAYSWPVQDNRLLWSISARSELRVAYDFASKKGYSRI